MDDKISILIVDDDPNTCRTLVDTLSWQGYVPLAAGDSRTALELVRDRLPAIVLIDLNLESASGMDLLKHLREQYPEVDCVIITGYATQESAIEAVNLGAYGYLVKPYHMENLLLTISRAVERRQAKEALLASEARYRTLVEAIPDSVFHLSKDGKVLYAKAPQAYRTTTQHEQLINRNIVELDPVIAPVVLAEMNSALETGQLVISEHEVIRSGKKEYREARFVPLADDQVMVLVRDITERRYAEDTIRATHSYYKGLISAISSILIGLTAEELVVFWNKVAEDVFNISSDQVIGAKFSQCKIQWNWERVQKGIQACLQKRSAIPLDDLQYLRPNGTIGILGIKIHPAPQEESQQISCVITGADITARRLMETQLTQARKLESIGQLAAGIAHEINTPTQYVGNNILFLEEAFSTLLKLLDRYQQFFEAAQQRAVEVRLIKELKDLSEESDLDYLTAEIPRAVQGALKGVNAISRIVQSMKEFSHPDREGLSLTNINRSIESTVDISRNEWKYVAEMKLDLDTELPLVPCYPGEINQVILNLLTNAVDAIKEVVGQSPAVKGEIKVSSRKIDGWVEIKVTDTGAGIPEHARERVFDPFFTTKEVGKGTGQGLYIAHKIIVEKHHGQIFFETELGKGTTFTIRLPLSDSAELQEA